MAFERGAEVRREYGDWIRAEGDEPLWAERLGALMREGEYDVPADDPQCLT